MGKAAGAWVNKWPSDVPAMIMCSVEDSTGDQYSYYTVQQATTASRRQKLWNRAKPSQ